MTDRLYHRATPDQVPVLERDGYRAVARSYYADWQPSILLVRDVLPWELELPPRTVDAIRLAEEVIP
jgi:hypothetical protein